MFLDKIQATEYFARVDQVCITQPPPLPQKRFNFKTNKTEWFKPDGTFYAPNEPQEKMKKYTESYREPTSQAACGRSTSFMIHAKSDDTSQVSELPVSTETLKV
jgi:hypothetical protein